MATPGTSSQNPARFFDEYGKVDVAGEKMYYSTIDFALHNFSLYKDQNRKICTYASNKQVINGDLSHWTLEIVPFISLPDASSVNSRGRMNCVGVYMALEGPHDIEARAICSIRIVNETGQELRPPKENVWTVGVKNGVRLSTQGWDNFISHEELKGFLIHDCLRIQAQLRFFVTHGGRVEHPRVSASDVLLQSLRHMLESGDKSDFKLVSSDEMEFPVHKFILSKHDYFAAMFQHDVKETRVGQCLLPEDGETIAGMLTFIYGKNIDWKPEVAEKLVYAANKYKIAALEKDCVAVLLNLLTIENAARYLKLADENILSGMKEHILEYIAGCFAEFSTGGGLDELESNFQLQVAHGVNQRKSKS